MWLNFTSARSSSAALAMISLPNAQVQHVLVGDDLQDDLFDSGHHHASFPTFRRLGAT